MIISPCHNVGEHQDPRLTGPEVALQIIRRPRARNSMHLYGARTTQGEQERAHSIGDSTKA